MNFAISHRFGTRSGPRLAMALGLLGLACIAALIIPGGAVSAPNDSADLRVTKSDSPDPATEGKVLTYSITVTNLGPDAATGVILTDVLPAGVEFVSATASQGNCTQKGKNVDCALGNLAVNASAQVTIKVKPRKAGSITNTATVDSVEMDPVAANNTATATTTVTAAGPNPNPNPNAPTCKGVAVTKFGTPGPDTIQGTAGRDVILALRGNDIIFGYGGRDLICANRGADVVKAGALGDRVIAGAGIDRVRGQGGDDRLFGNVGNDFLFGGRGADLLAGGLGNDVCRGGFGLDVLRNC